jgi:hypothetical protein
LLTSIKFKNSFHYSQFHGDPPFANERRILPALLLFVRPLAL